ncbi:hypothetical protein [Actinoplanes sp. NPDC049802]|uniref:hypothetical protein n=1 Tax=Actinoplanes sp. NPDC049802 TaxID=3154742 RepID=UPI0033CC6EF3
MTETGWPLIPRDALPSSIPVERKHAPRGVPGPPGGRQLSMFGAETTEPSPADLAGLLAGPGRLGRMGGTARVTVRVDAAWRVHVLVSELAARDLKATWAQIPPDGVREEPTDSAQEAATPGPAADEPPDPEPIGDESLDTETAGDDSLDTQPPDTEAIDTAGLEEEPEEPPLPIFEVRTAYSRRLNGLALAWPEASAQLFLSGPRMRLWTAAAGGPFPGGFALGLDPAKDPEVVAAALVRAGLAGRVSDDGRRWLITGRRRLRRLAELVGERPSSAPEDFWPGDGVA